jgi:hypothetical protein
MKSFFTSILVLSAAVSMALADSAPAPHSCGEYCRFTFCPDQPYLSLGTPDTAISNAICDKYHKIYVGHVDSTGEACVEEHKGCTPISHYYPSGLLQKFSPSFWKSFGLYYHDLSGVGHETPQQNQASFLHGKCFVLPLTAYQVLSGPYGNVIDNVHPTNPHVDCVAFSVY